ncbi:MAG: hypothetical protein ACYDBB_25785 [Armatimonadota bacterium]
MTVRFSLLWQRRWVRIVCLLTISALLGYGIYRRYSPPSLRLVARVPGSNPVACVAGCLVHTDEITATLVDWHTGKPLWHVSTPLKKTETGNTSQTSISSDGRTYAAAVVRTGRMRLFIWRDGALTTDLLLPPLKDTIRFDSVAYGVHALENGHVLCWQPGYDGLHIYQASQGRLIARGLLPCPTFREKFSGYAQYPTASWAIMAPDGETIALFECLPMPSVSSIYCWTLAVTGTTIRGTPHTCFAPGDSIRLLAGGFYADCTRMSVNPISSKVGAVYKGWPHCDNGTAVVLGDDTGLQVVIPATQSQWTFPQPTGVMAYYGSSVTPNGRFAVGYVAQTFDPARYPQPLRWALELTHIRMPRKTWLIVAERPGVIRAILPMKPLEFPPVTGTRQRAVMIDRYLISPDGHALITENSDHECLLMRW